MLNAEMNLHILLIKFRDFLALNWSFIGSVDAQDKSDALLIDWIQVNWEMLVERQLPNSQIILEIYGDGADNGKSSRIQDMNALPTHRVLCTPKSGSLIFDCLNKVKVDAVATALVLERFVSMRPNGWYYEEPPFDKVLCFIDDSEVVFNVDDIEFKLGNCKGEKA